MRTICIEGVDIQTYDHLRKLAKWIKEYNEMGQESLNGLRDILDVNGGLNTHTETYLFSISTMMHMIETTADKLVDDSHYFDEFDEDKKEA